MRDDGGNSQNYNFNRKLNWSDMKFKKKTLYKYAIFTIYTKVGQNCHLYKKWINIVRKVTTVTLVTPVQRLTGSGF